MIVDEMQLLSGLGEVPPLPAEVSQAAKARLRAEMTAEDHLRRSRTADRRRRDGVRRTAVGGDRRHRRALAGAVGLAAGVALVAGGLNSLEGGSKAAHPAGNGQGYALSPSGGGSRTGLPVVTIGGHAAANPQTVLYRLASASVAQAAPTGRYAVLSETDTETGYPGEFKRTTVVDTRTGASTTYQQAYSTSGQAVPNSEYHGPPPTTVANPTPAQQAKEQLLQQAYQRAQQTGTGGPPTVLTGGPDATSTEAWYSALPTDPTALRAKLLGLANQSGAETPGYTTDDNVYQQADTMLWSPLVPPALRSALYKVLASTTGFSVAQGSDPAGRAAIVMTRTYTGGSETDTTYEDPATGAVLAQIWKVGNDTTTAVYQPVTSTDTIPPNPYQG